MKTENIVSWTKIVRKVLLLATFVSLLLLISAKVHAQGGNDFPIDFPPLAPNLPGSQLIWSPEALQRAGYYQGTVAGPYALGIYKNDRAIIRLRSRYFPGPMNWTLQCSGCEVSYPNPGDDYWNHGSAGEFCFDCLIQIKATDNSPEFWIDGQVPYQFFQTHGLIVEVVQIIPRPIWTVFTDPDKETAGELAIYSKALTGLFAGCIAKFSGAPYLGGACGLLGSGTGILSGFYDGVHHDPAAGDYCTDAQFDNSNSVSQLEQYRGYDGTWDFLIDVVEDIDGLTTQGIEAINKAAGAADDGSDCFWTQAYIARSAGRGLGDRMWKLRWVALKLADYYSAQGYDMDFIYQNIDFMAQAASWLGDL